MGGFIDMNLKPPTALLAGLHVGGGSWGSLGLHVSCVQDYSYDDYSGRRLAKLDKTKYFCKGRWEKMGKTGTFEVGANDGKRAAFLTNWLVVPTFLE